jgi:hypothetical protein
MDALWNSFILVEFAQENLRAIDRVFRRRQIRPTFQVRRTVPAELCHPFLAHDEAGRTPWVRRREPSALAVRGAETMLRLENLHAGAPTGAGLLWKSDRL